MVSFHFLASARTEARTEGLCCARESLSGGARSATGCTVSGSYRAVSCSSLPRRKYRDRKAERREKLSVKCPIHYKTLFKDIITWERDWREREERREGDTERHPRILEYSNTVK